MLHQFRCDVCGTRHVFEQEHLGKFPCLHCRMLGLRSVGVAYREQDMTGSDVTTGGSESDRGTGHERSRGVHGLKSRLGRNR